MCVFLWYYDMTRIPEGSGISDFPVIGIGSSFLCFFQQKKNWQRAIDIRMRLSTVLLYVRTSMIIGLDLFRAPFERLGSPVCVAGTYTYMLLADWCRATSVRVKYNILGC